MSATLTEVMPSTTPSDEEIAAWEKLSREEQLERLRLEMAHPDCDLIATDTMADILALARQRAARKQDA